MFSVRTVLFVKHSQYHLFRTSVIRAQQGKYPQLLQENVAKLYHSHLYGSRHQAVGAAQTTSYDAATSRGEHGDVSGNPEGAGFAEQVGSQSFSTKKGERGQHRFTGKQEDTISLGKFSMIKKNLGLGTTTRVMGIGSFRPEEYWLLHTSIIVHVADPVESQAPQGNRQPEDSMYGDQSAHLRHKSYAKKAGAGKGNAAASLKRPSYQVRRSWHVMHRF